MSNFTIDFFELAFLAEVCIPPRPIARAMFWQNLTDMYWQQMLESERVHLFEWMNRNDTYKHSLLENEDTQIFHARFDPENQFEVTITFKGEEKTFRAFYHDGKYKIDNRTYIDPDNIIKAEKKNFTNN